MLLLLLLPLLLLLLLLMFVRWSWVITSAAVCCYGLGFVAMTPQLFRNYYLKSVQCMPWSVLFYQFINTFIDDVAAYVIRMPHMHR